MTNAKKFAQTFGLYATEMWAMPEKEFLKWLNDEYAVKRININDNKRISPTDICHP